MDPAGVYCTPRRIRLLDHGAVGRVDDPARSPGQAVVPVSMYIRAGYGTAEASMTVPGAIASREMRTSMGPTGMSRTSR